MAERATLPAFVHACTGEALAAMLEPGEARPGYGADPTKPATSGRTPGQREDPVSRHGVPGGRQSSCHYGTNRPKPIPQDRR